MISLNEIMVFMLYFVLISTPTIAFDHLYHQTFFKQTINTYSRITYTDMFAICMIPIATIMVFILNICVVNEEYLLLASALMLYVAGMGLAFKMFWNNNVVRYTSVIVDSTTT